jgi:hypothetical protein
MTSTTNLIDLPWIPVRRGDGTEANLGLREMFMGAHELTEITASSPLEHEAITRFLTTVTALVVRAADEDWDPRDDAQFPPVAVDTALSQVAAHLDLAALYDPFMQDVSTGDASDFKAGHVTSLSLDRPNSTVQAWHFRRQLDERPDGQVDWARLGVLLITFWYFAGTNNVDIAGRKQAGSLCGKAGNGLHLFWRGPSLAHTLLANTPLSWAEGSDLPAWADRDGSTSRATFQSAVTDSTPLWWASYSPNTVMVWADEKTGLPAWCKTGGSYRQPKGTPAPLTRAAKDVKAKEVFAERYPEGTSPDGTQLVPHTECLKIAKELSEADKSKKDSITTLAESLRASDQAGTFNVDKKVNAFFTRMSPDLATLRNLSEWYSAGAADLLKQRVTEVVLPPSLCGNGWALEFCHTRTKNPTVPIYTSAAWVGRTPEESSNFTLNPDEAKAVLSVAKRVEDMANILCGPLSKGSILAELVRTKRDLKDHFYVLADAACTQAITDAVNGKEMTRDVLKAVGDAALDAFDDIVTPFAGPALGPSIIQARSSVQRDLAMAAAK